MTPDKSTLVAPALLIIVGTGWLLTTIGIIPEVNWVWTLTLAGAGLLTLLLSGFDKVTFVVGSFLILTSGLSLLRQTGRLHIDLEIPILVIAAGVLLFIARLPFIPPPKWLQGK